MRRIVTGLVLLVFSGALLFAEGQQESTESELRVMWWGSQTRHELTIELLELYAERNPDLTVTHEFAGWSDYWTKLTTMAAGRNLPAVMQHDYAFLTEWESRGLLQPMDEFVASGVLDFSDVPEGSIDSGRVDGHLYGVNLGVNSEVMVLDADMFEEAGIPIPPDDWTWEDFEEIAMELTEELGVYGYGAGIMNEQIWKGLYISEGMDIFAADGSGLGYSDDTPHLEFIEMVLRLQEAEAIPHISREASDFAHGENAEQKPIITGEAAMDYMWSNQLTAMWTAAGGPDARNFVLLPPPRRPGGRASNYVKPSMFFSITRDAPDPEAAAAFIDFVTNDIDANKVLMAERGVPIADGVREALAPLVDRPQQVIFEYMGRIASFASPTPPPDPAGYADLRSNVYNTVIRDGIRFGQYTPEEAVALWREEAQTILGEAAGN
jgi:multiple sugar transport system substrate-binding protein